MLPDYQLYKSDTEYFRQLVARIGKSQRWISERLGISQRRLRYLTTGTRPLNGENHPVLMDYIEQYALEQLAIAAELMREK